MKRRDPSVLRILSRTEFDISQTLAREALEIANKLPDTTVRGAIDRGVKEGLMERVDENTYKLVGRRGPERK